MAKFGSKLLTNRTRRSQKLTPRRTKTKPKIIRKGANLLRKFAKNFRKISHPVNRLTDIQEIANYFKLAYQHPSNVTKNV